MYEQTGRTDRRGQTTLDFAIAMGLFLLAVAFTFMFIPSLTTPFVAGQQDGSVAADRVASHLSEGGLGDPDEPFVVEQSCATPFFADADPSNVPDHCGYSGTGYEERVGVGDNLDVHVDVVHVEPDSEGDARFRIVCVDGGTVTHNGTSTDCESKDPADVYRIGPEPTSDSSVSVARRIVTFPDCEFEKDSCDATIRVMVW